MPKGLHRPVPDCHPAKAHYAKGLCFDCYRRGKYRHNPEYRAANLAAVKAYQSRNKDLIRTRRKDHYLANRERILAKGKKTYRENYDVIRFRKKLQQAGCTKEHYERMLSEQKGLCAICSRKNKNGKALVIDHCHKTGVVRGLLCTRCNCGIGILEDSAVMLGKALRYLSQTQITTQLEESKCTLV